jgi:hypothetical protein
LSTQNHIADLPLARAFPDTGLAVMRTSLTDRNGDIAFQVKASPMGSISHSHADQGNFYLAAYGEPLLIPSGHYQGGYEALFGSPHHAGWTWQSWAHNVPLIDGKGQGSRNPEANGYLEHFYHSDLLDFVRVDITRAYLAGATAEAPRAVAKAGAGLAARIGEAPVKSVRRNIIFLRPGTFVIVDEIECSRAATVDWLLHAWNRFEIDGQRAVVKNGVAAASIQLVSDAGAGISQSNEFTVPLSDKYKKQWHLTAAYPARLAHRITAVITPSRVNEVGAADPRVSRTAAGIRLEWPDGRACSVSQSGTTSMTVDCGAWVYVSDATAIVPPGGGKITFSAPVDALARRGTVDVAGATPFEVPGRGSYPAGKVTLRP